MKSFLKEKKITTRSLSDQTKIPYSTLNDIVNGKTDLNSVKFEYIKRIAKALDISIDDFDRLFCTKKTEQNVDYTVITKNKNYYLLIEGRKEPLHLCKATLLNSEYIDELAAWEYQDIKRKEKLENW